MTVNKNLVFDEEFSILYDRIATEVQSNGLHVPIMTKEISFMAWHFLKLPNIYYLDGTFGRGGHYTYMRKFFPQMKALCLDQDLQAIQYAEQKFREDINAGNLTLNNLSFFDEEFLSQNKDQFDFVLLDLGVSSPQLDDGARGFSFLHEGPLDMRMNRAQEVSAATLINESSEEELNQIFKNYGEVRSPYRVTRALVNDRQIKRYETTREVASLIERVDGWRKKGFHPATQYFMALRLAVNSELEGLEKSLPRVLECLKDKGLLAVLSFHSLEDRIVKNVFKSSEVGQNINKKVIVASDEEVANNPRSRSAKLRVFQKTLL
jgi:16S rRNA (cytosine1402-N4)-methyltransferase